MDTRQYLIDEQKEVLAKARETYGDTAQILVSNEELCELAAVCAKFPRYDDPGKARADLHSKAVDEVADVIIVLDHIINIFDLTDTEIASRIGGKIDRLWRWMKESNSMEQTTVDRKVEEVPAHCTGCEYKGDFKELAPGGRCSTCSMNNFVLYRSKEEET